MKIAATNTTTLAPLTNGAPRTSTSSDATGAVSAAQAAGAADQRDSTVSLSPMSALHASSDADIDTAKVEAIKAALRDGTYQIDSGKIADGMLASARELVQKGPR